jgi:hypothetical protein
MREFMVPLERDPAAWSAAFGPALLALNGAHDLVVDAWQRTPAIRAPMLRTIAQIAAKPPAQSAGPWRDWNSSAQGHASRAFRELMSGLCPTPARAEFETLAAQNVPQNNPAWPRNATPGRVCQSY